VTMSDSDPFSLFDIFFDLPSDEPDFDFDECFLEDPGSFSSISDVGADVCSFTSIFDGGADVFVGCEVVVGLKDGKPDGVAVGADVGIAESVGCELVVGLRDGKPDGAVVGELVVGLKDGKPDGVAVGAVVGIEESVGCELVVGLRDGKPDGVAVGEDIAFAPTSISQVSCGWVELLQIKL
jgi:hypothetical protein